MTNKKSEPAVAHPIDILREEHKIILQNLEQLKSIANRIAVGKGFGEIAGQLEHLKEIVHLLLDTESHHRREEEAIFPRLEKHGVIGPPRVMRVEHEALRAAKKKLAELVEQGTKIDYREFSRGLSEIGDYIATNLSNHIFKEDNILYPMASETFALEEWSEVRREFDQIGYCCFTPGLS